MRSILTFFALALVSLALAAQNSAPTQVQPDQPHREWQASWATHPTAPLREPLVLHFRRSVTLAAVPASYPVRVSADNRFILYVNGHRVGDGPARGDLAHWRYERFDLAPLLQPGKNLITATVWNFGVYGRRRALRLGVEFAFGCWTSLGSCRLAHPREHLPNLQQGSLCGCDRRQCMGAGA